MPPLCTSTLCSLYLLRRDASASFDRYLRSSMSRSSVSSNSYRSLICNPLQSACLLYPALDGFVGAQCRGTQHSQNRHKAGGTLTRMSRSKSYSKRFRCSCSAGGKSLNRSPILASCEAAEGAVLVRFSDSAAPPFALLANVHRGKCGLPGGRGPRRCTGCRPPGAPPPSGGRKTRTRSCSP